MNLLVVLYVIITVNRQMNSRGCCIGKDTETEREEERIFIVNKCFYNIETGVSLFFFTLLSTPSLIHSDELTAACPPATP